MPTDLQPIIYKAEVLLLELAQLNQRGPSLEVIHNYRIKGIADCCLPGEEVSRVILAHRGRHYIVPLPLALRLVTDYLARYRHISQSATQIAAGMRVSEFYRRHGMNSGESSRLRISRSTVKEYVKRIRHALAKAFCEAELHLNPAQVLVSEATVSNETTYRLRATVNWHHCMELPARHPDIQRHSGGPRRNCERAI